MSSSGPDRTLAEGSGGSSDVHLLSAREGLAKLELEGHRYRLDQDLAHDVALRVLNGPAAGLQRPWVVWRAYFRTAAAKIRSSLAQRRSLEHRIGSEVLVPEAIRREGAVTPADEVLDARETAAQVVAVFRTLSSRDQELLLRWDWLGQPPAAIAGALSAEDSVRARNTIVKAHGRAKDAFINRLKRAFGDDYRLAGSADPEAMRVAFLTLAADAGLFAPAETPPEKS